MARVHFSRPLQDTITGGTGNELPVALITNASIAVYLPGTTTLISDTLWADDSSETTISNPFVCETGQIDFYLDAPERVRIGTTPVGGDESFFEDIDVGVTAEAAGNSVLPPPVMAVFDGSAYPARAAVSTNDAQPVIWVGPDNNKVTIGTGFAQNGVDFFWGF